MDHKEHETPETASVESTATPSESMPVTPAATPSNKRNKIIILAILIIVIGAVAYYTQGNDNAATVNGSAISRKAVLDELEKSAGKKALDNMITEKLIIDAAAAKNITIGSDVIDQEMQQVEEQIKAQGLTLDAALASQGITIEDARKQIMIRKTLELLLVDKTTVTDAEVEQYIKDNKVTIPKGEEDTMKAGIKEQLASEKFDQEAQTYIEGLRSSATIVYFGQYK